MSELLEYTQTSGNDWNNLSEGLLYNSYQPVIKFSDTTRRNSVLVRLEDEMARFEADHQALILEVRRFYIMPIDLGIEIFFNSHRALPQLLAQAIPYLERYFVDTLFELRTASDEYGWQVLYVDALWSGKAHDAIAALDKFEDAWWIEASAAASGSMIFTYRLV